MVRSGSWPPEKMAAEDRVAETISIIIATMLTSSDDELDMTAVVATCLRHKD